MALINCTINQQTFNKNDNQAIGGTNANLTITPNIGHSVTASKFSHGILPTGVDSITITDNGTAGSFSNTLNVLVDLTDSFVMPAADTSIIIDVDGTADKGEQITYKIDGIIQCNHANASVSTTPTLPSVGSYQESYSSAGIYDPKGANPVTLFTKVFTASSGYIFESEPLHTYIAGDKGALSNYQITKEETTGTFAGKNCTVITVTVKYIFPENDVTGDYLVLTLRPTQVFDASTGKIHDYKFEKSTIPINYYGDSRELVLYGDVDAQCKIQAYNNASTGTSLLGAAYNSSDKTVTIGNDGTYRETIEFPGAVSGTTQVYSVKIIEIDPNSFLFNSGNSPLVLTLNQYSELTISYGFDCSTVGVYNIPTSHTVTYPPQQLIDKTVNNLRFDATIQAVSNSTVLTSVSSPEYLNRSDFGTAANPILADGSMDAADVTAGYVQSYQGGTKINPLEDLKVVIDNTTTPSQAVFSGEASFNTIGTLNATFVIDIDKAISVNNAPVAAGQSITTPFETAWNGTLGVTDADGDTITYSIVSQPSNGTATVNSSTGAAVYTPNSSFTGSDSFTFKGNDGHSDSNVASIAVTVSAGNTAPVASNQSGNTNTNTAATFSLTATDADGDSLTYSIVSNPSNGSLGSISGNSVTYTPTAGFNGNDSFTWKANDGTADSNTATFSILVSAVPTAPEGVTTTPISSITNTGATTGISMSGDGGSAVTAKYIEWGTTADFAGTAQQSSSLGTGTASASFTISGLSAGTEYKARAFAQNSVGTSYGSFLTFTTTGGNSTPTCTDDSYSTNRTTNYTVVLAANDADGDTLTWSIDSLPANGTLRDVGNAPPTNITSTGAILSNSVLYVPDATYTGNDPFTYSVSDGTASSSSCTITMTVVLENLAPTDIAISSSSFDESPSTGQNVGNLSTTDANSGDSHTYTLVSGSGSTDNSKFQIVGNTVKTNQAFDYETDGSGPFQIRVRSTDNGGLYFEKIFNLFCQDVSVYFYRSGMQSGCSAFCNSNYLMQVATQTTNEHNYASVSLGDEIEGGLANGWYAYQNTNTSAVTSNANASNYKIMQITDNQVSSIATNNSGSCAIA